MTSGGFPLSTGGSTSKLVPESGQAASKTRSFLGPGAAELTSLRSELELARSEFRGHQPTDAEARLIRLIESIDRILMQSSSLLSADPSQYYLLRASALTLLGRTRGRLEKPSDDDFKQAVATFEHWLPKASEASGQFHRDYGMALLRLGDKASAKKALLKAVDAGVGDAETYRYLGVTYFKMHQHTDAELHLKRALELEPEEPSAYIELARNCVAQGQNDVAISLYLNAAYLSGSQPKDTLRYLGHVLELDPDNGLALAAKAEVLYSFGRFAEAAQAAREAVECYSSPEVPLTTLGAALGAMGRFTEAKAALNRALEGNPKYVPALVGEGEILKIQGKYLEALEVLDRALKLQPTSAVALANKADVLRLQERYSEALEALDRAIQLAPEYPAGLAIKAEVLRITHREDEAFTLVERALELSPDYAFALGVKGELLRMQHRYEEALGYLDRAVKLSPNDVFALNARAVTLAAQEQYQDALDSVQRALEASGNAVAVLATRGDIHRMMGSYQKALKDLELALAQAPDNARVLSIKAATLFAMDQVEEASGLATRVLDLNPTEPLALETKGRILLSKGEPALAAEILSQAADAHASSAALYGDLVVALREVGRYDEAIRATDRLLDLRPKDIQTYRNKAYLLIAQGQTDQAIAVLKRAAQLEPEAAALTADMAYVHLLGEDYDEAKALIEAALGQDQDDAWSLSVWGLYLMSIAEYEQAAKVLERATHRDPDRHAAYGWLGCTLQVLASMDALEGRQGERAAHAVEALNRAIELNSSELIWHTALADALRVAGQRPQANEKYESVIGIAGPESPKLDSRVAIIYGWCHYQLGHYRVAIRAFVEAQSLNPSNVTNQFNVALASLRKHQHEVGLREYQRGVKMADARHPLARRGFLSIALLDLREAIAEEARAHPGPDTSPPIRHGLHKRKKPEAPLLLGDRPETRAAVELLQDALTRVSS